MWELFFPVSRCFHLNWKSISRAEDSQVYSKSRSQRTSQRVSSLVVKTIFILNIKFRWGQFRGAHWIVFYAIPWLYRNSVSLREARFIIVFRTFLRNYYSYTTQRMHYLELATGPEIQEIKNSIDGSFSSVDNTCTSTYHQILVEWTASMCLNHY